MHRWVKWVAASVLISGLCPVASASTYTHFWTLDGTSDGIGLVGIVDGPGETRTQVNYGKGVLDHFWIPLPIYAVVAIPMIVFLLVCTPIAYTRFRRRSSDR